MRVSPSTLEELELAYQRYVREVVNTGLALGSRDTYRQNIRRFIEWLRCEYTPKSRELIRQLKEGAWLTAPQAAARLDFAGTERVRVLCRQGRIVGAQKCGNVWLIPDPPVILPRSTSTSD